MVQDQWLRARFPLVDLDDVLERSDRVETIRYDKRRNSG
jgi:hypothetical protein